MEKIDEAERRLSGMLHAAAERLREGADVERVSKAVKEAGEKAQAPEPKVPRDRAGEQQRREEAASREQGIER